MKKSINQGSKNPMWKGGRVMSSGGYILLRSENHPRATKKGLYVFEHILVMEKKIKRHLISGEIVHHKNGNKTDNRILNLVLMTQSEHMKHHEPTYHYKKGQKFSLIHRQRIAEAKKKWWDKKMELINVK